MDRLARILFQMDAFNAHQTRHTGRHFDQHFPLAHDGVVKLADLIALRQVGVEIVLAVKGRTQVDRSLQPQPRAHRLFDAKGVDNRQHARHGRIDKSHVGIGFRPHLGRGARKELGVRGDLGMDLHPDHQFPIMLCPGNHLGGRLGIGQVKHQNLRRCSWPFRQGAGAVQGQRRRKAATRGASLPTWVGFCAFGPQKPRVTRSVTATFRFHASFRP